MAYINPAAGSPDDNMPVSLNVRESDLAIMRYLNPLDMEIAMLKEHVGELKNVAEASALALIVVGGGAAFFLLLAVLHNMT